MTNKQIKKEEFLINFYLNNKVTNIDLLNYYENLGLIKNSILNEFFFIEDHFKNFIPKTEDFVKYNLCKYLISQNWVVLQCAYGKSHGTDIIAIHKDTKEILKIEAKGASYHGADGVNLNTAIGEILRDLESGVKYMMAFPSNTGLQKMYLKDYKNFKERNSDIWMDKIFVVYDNGDVKIEK